MKIALISENTVEVCPPASSGGPFSGFSASTVEASRPTSVEPFDTIVVSGWTALISFPLFFLGCVCTLLFTLTTSCSPAAFALALAVGSPFFDFSASIVGASRPT